MQHPSTRWCAARSPADLVMMALSALVVVVVRCAFLFTYWREHGRHLVQNLSWFMQDVGIDNGLHRVVQNLPAVRAADVIIVVAGMDGSLPSVIAGLVDSPVVRRCSKRQLSSTAAHWSCPAHDLVLGFRFTRKTSRPCYVMLHCISMRIGQPLEVNMPTTVKFNCEFYPSHVVQIAVPTSVGYGAAFGGVSPLLSALTAGAPGVATVNVRPACSQHVTSSTRDVGISIE